MPPRKVLLIGGAAVVAAVLVLVLVMRKRAAALDEAEGSAAGMLPASLSSTEGARAASLGLVLPGSGGIVTPPPPQAPAEQPLESQQSAAAPEPAPDVYAGTGDPTLDNLIAQGVYVTEAPQTIASNIPGHEGETYLIPAGTPEFSPGNFNPNSPAGVLAMNKALGLMSAPVTIPGTAIGAPSLPPNFYEADNAAASAAILSGPQGGGKMIAF